MSVLHLSLAVPWHGMGFKGASKVSAGTWVKWAVLISWGAVLSGGNFSAPGAGSSLITARPGYPCSPLLLQGHFRMFSPWLVVWMLQMKWFGKHICLFCFGERITSLERWQCWDCLWAFLFCCGKKGLFFRVGLLFSYTGVLVFY